MKKKALITSLLTIALCLSLIAGSTFALFTDTSNVNIAIGAGKVDMTAGLDALQLWSVVADENGTEHDENGHSYTYQQQTTNFINGGKATINAEMTEITLTKVTPGDKITFQLTGANASDVKIQYRFRIEVVEGFKLAQGFVVTVGEATGDKKYEALAEYTSDWYDLPAKTAMDNVNLALELPVAAGNEYQTLTTKYRIYVDAVQYNADVAQLTEPEVSYIRSAKTAAEAEALLESDEPLYVFLDEDITDTIYVTKSASHKTIDANGKNLNIDFGTKATGTIQLDDFVVANVVDNPTENSVIVINGSTTGNLTIYNCKLHDTVGTPYGAIAGDGMSANLDLTIDKCDFTADADEINSLYAASVNNLTVTNSTFTGGESWALLVNEGVAGNVLISGCTFTNCNGIVKLDHVDGDFTFVNNTMVGCAGMENLANYFADVDPVTGDITFTGNIIDNVPATIDDMAGETKGGIKK